MRRFSIVLSMILVLSVVGTVLAFAVGIPEVDRPNATMVLDPIGKFKKANCIGEDGVPYVTFRGRWEGGENDVTPGSTDYNLNGPLTIARVVWTVNRSTERGVLRAHISVVDPVSLQLTYAGRITL